MKFTCELCEWVGRSESKQRTHYLFEHQILKPSCQSHKALDYFSRMDELSDTYRILSKMKPLDWTSAETFEAFQTYYELKLLKSNIIDRSHDYTLNDWLDTLNIIPHDYHFITDKLRADFDINIAKRFHHMRIKQRLSLYGVFDCGEWYCTQQVNGNTCTWYSFMDDIDQSASYTYKRVINHLYHEHGIIAYSHMDD